MCPADTWEICPGCLAEGQSPVMASAPVFESSGRFQRQAGVSPAVPSFQKILNDGRSGSEAGMVPTTPMARSPRRPAGTSRAGKAWCAPGFRDFCVHRPALRWKAGDGPPTWPPTQDRKVVEKRTLGIAFRALLRSPTAVAYFSRGSGEPGGEHCPYWKALQVGTRSRDRLQSERDRGSR